MFYVPHKCSKYPIYGAAATLLPLTKFSPKFPLRSVQFEAKRPYSRKLLGFWHLKAIVQQVNPLKLDYNILVWSFRWFFLSEVLLCRAVSVIYLLCYPGWPQSCTSSPVSASQILELGVWTTRSCSPIHF